MQCTYKHVKAPGPKSNHFNFLAYVPPPPTIETMIDVNVELLWTETVPKMPNIRPTTGFLRKELAKISAGNNGEII